MSGRAHGRRGTGRPVREQSPEELEAGISPLQSAEGSPIHDLTGNVTNTAVKRQIPAVPDHDLPEHRGMMAHGVKPDEHTAHERASSERGDRPREPKVKARGEAAAVTPVPVYLVESHAGGHRFLSSSPRHITVPNTASDPVRVCGRGMRKRIGLLNEDTATNIRFAQRISDLTNGGGALLPYPVNSYQWFYTQDELYAVTISTTATAVLSIIEEFEQGY